MSIPGTASHVDRDSTYKKHKSKKSRKNDYEDVDREAKKFKFEVRNYFDKVGKVDRVEKCRCKHHRKLYTCKATTHGFT